MNVFHNCNLILAVRKHHLGPVRRWHQVRVAGPRGQSPVQVFDLPQLSLQGQVALQDICRTRAAIQGTNTWIPCVRMPLFVLIMFNFVAMWDVISLLSWINELSILGWVIWIKQNYRLQLNWYFFSLFYLTVSNKSKFNFELVRTVCNAVKLILLRTFIINH